MSQNLPYPGFSWSLTQHMGRATAKTAFELLQAAYIYSGDANFRQLVADYLVEQNLLTANQREDSGQADAWRDYQQLLSELGLIVSTRFTKKNEVMVTPIGLMWLDGMIGYSEFITTQCLKYQYPNGMKLDIQAYLGSELQSNSIEPPNNRAQLDAIFGVRIKPAVLILRVLLGLYNEGEINPRITVDECIEALLPIKTNQEWRKAFQNLQRIRQNPQNIKADSRARRHIQEWFSFLGYTDLFEISPNSRDFISLSHTTLENLAQVIELCDYHEADSSFWTPTSDDREELGISWFAYFGNPNVNEQWFSMNTSEFYLEQNYPEGIEEDESEIIQRDVEIRLQPYMPRIPKFQSKLQINREAIARGHESRQKSAKLHEEIVALVAQKLKNGGYELSEDPNSVDLLAATDDHEAIVEVKTTTKKNIYARMRLGVGQLSEYRYRREEQVKARPSGILVLSSDGQFPNWLISYFATDIKLGLISLASFEKFTAHTKGDIEDIICS